ncbi:serine/threonine-protein kinase [Nonomuraea diastatica]|nr:serine/threonine-protein kinase [Nonomuraea diastatica]
MRVAGRYRLDRNLSRGRIGEVWLAHDLELGRDVVLKRLAAAGAAGFDRLWAEGRALARFSHPHVVTLYDRVRSKRRGAASWLVMEYVPGGSLDGRPPMPPSLAARLGAEIAGAVAALHAAGIVHCDIKPGNIVVTGDGAAKLADFGAAYRAGDVETISPNGPSSFTPAYAAPEVMQGRPVPESDVFSLGATVYALIAGEAPRRGAPPQQETHPPEGEPRGWDDTDAYVAAREAARASILLEADVGPLAGVLSAMVRPEPADRPDAAGARRLLEQVAGAHEPVPEPVDADGAEPGGPPGSRRRWRPAVAASAAAGAAALVLILAWLNVHGDHPRATAAPTPVPAPVHRADLRGADPCALLDPVSLRGFGRAELDRQYGNFDRCDVIVQPPGDDTEVDVLVDFDLDPPPEGIAPARTVGVVSVVENPEESDTCYRTLVLSGVHDSTVRVIAKRYDPGRAPLCAIADAATATAVDAFNRGPLERRSPPANSLIHQDACTLLTAKALAIVPGVDAADPDPGFGNWDCDWESTTSHMDVSLRFDQGRPPSAEDGTSTRLNGYRAFLIPEGEGDGTCLVQVVYRFYRSLPGGQGAETVRLLVKGDHPVDRLCTVATDLARAATARLPRA